MRLHYIVNARIPTEKAHGLQIVKMCEAFAEHGLKVTLVTPFRIQKHEMRGISAFEYYNVKELFRIKKLPMPDLIHISGFLPVKIGTLLFHIHDMLFSILSTIYSVFGGSDIIFTRDSKVAFFASFFRPVIYESHMYPESKIDRFFEKRAFCRCKFFIVITDKLKEIYIENGYDKGRIHVLHDAVDISKFDIDVQKKDARKKLGTPVNDKIVVYTGHLYRWKGVYTLIDASKYIDAQIILVGGLEDDIKKVQKYISKNNIKNVRMVGHVTPGEVPLYLKAADVLVLPNSAEDKRSIYYTSPLKVFEYMASRRPIVASDLPSIREILDESCAVMVAPDTPEALAEGINRVLNDNELADNIAKNAYSKVKRHTWTERSRTILETMQHSRDRIR